MPDITAHSPDEFLQNFREQPLSPPVALYAGAALHRAGRVEEAVAVWTIGADGEPLLRKLFMHQDVGEELRRYSKLADDAIRAHFNDLHRRTVETVEAQTGTTLPRVHAGIWPHFAAEPFEYQTSGQRPLNFYMPDLPAVPITESKDLNWAAPIEAVTEDILAEYRTAVDADAEFNPYVFQQMAGSEWNELRESDDWSALYLYYNADETDVTKAFPKTTAALQNAPLVKRDGLPLEVFFSRLTPGTKIPPHYGLTNTRLTVHLPLIIPDSEQSDRPWLRVGDAIHHWQEGQLIGFDDSFQHEASNPTDSDRTVLIFEAHHPDLSDHEIAAIEAVYAAFETWGKSRRSLLNLDADEGPTDS
ncbi:MAG: aspartyl/asparaginyl beta-hydroxylase domain-containing protein [Pseudomonadota bacterium]